MRKIKFRAWDKQNNKIVNWEEFGCVALDDCLRGKSENYILMQFTGLLDKNGKDIYCSDFVGVSKEKYGEVYWNNDELAWWIEPIGEYPNEPLRGKGNAVEVLGNKFEGIV